jgi:hypothetical protein
MKDTRTVIGTIAIFAFVGVLTTNRSLFALEPANTDTKAPEYTESFMLKECDFSSTGNTPYFVLKPGYRLILGGQEGSKKVRLTITVLDDTEMIDSIETRVVEERETKDNELIEVSRNFFAICKQTNTVFYFGEDVDIYKKGKIVAHEGAWRAGSNGAKAGVMMPGIILLGARYYQEVAPGVAMDRAEIVSISEIVDTPKGKYEDCLKVKETTPLEPGAEEYKLYAPRIGLVQDGVLKLTEYGYLGK